MSISSAQMHLCKVGSPYEAFLDRALISVLLGNLFCIGTWPNLMLSLFTCSTDAGTEANECMQVFIGMKLLSLVPSGVQYLGSKH